MKLFLFFPAPLLAYASRSASPHQVYLPVANYANESQVGDVAEIVEDAPEDYKISQQFTNLIGTEAIPADNQGHYGSGRPTVVVAAATGTAAALAGVGGYFGVKYLSRRNLKSCDDDIDDEEEARSSDGRKSIDGMEVRESEDFWPVTKPTVMTT